MAVRAFLTETGRRDPWVAQRFGACLWPRARSWRPGIESHVGLPVHGACFSLCLCLCLSLSLCDYHKKKKKKLKKKSLKILQKFVFDFFYKIYLLIGEIVQEQRGGAEGEGEADILLIRESAYLSPSALPLLILSLSLCLK